MVQNSEKGRATSQYTPPYIHVKKFSIDEDLQNREKSHFYEFPDQGLRIMG
jgi:hypothetical protein